MYKAPPAGVKVKVTKSKGIDVVGVHKAKGTELTVANLKTMPTWQSWLAKGWIKLFLTDGSTEFDPYGRRLGGPVKGRPVHLDPEFIDKLFEAMGTPDLSFTATVDPVDSRTWNVAITNPEGPFTVAWGDTATEVVAGHTAVHQYATAGAKTIRVTNSEGDTTTRSITVVENRPVPVFSASVDHLAVTFTGSASHSPTAWAWDFGDTETASTQSPVHSYAEAGVYTVTLTATNAFGSLSVTHDVTAVA